MQFYILGYSTVCDLHYNNIHILFRCKVLYLVLKRSCVFKRFATSPVVRCARSIRLFVRPCPQCTPPARRRAPRQHAKGAAATAVLRRGHRQGRWCCRAGFRLLWPCRLPLWDCLYTAGQAALGQCCRAPGIVGPVARRCCGGRMLQRYCLFSLPGQKKERGS